MAGALLDFLELYRTDRAAGIQRTTEEYAARFPGLEQAIRSEHARQEAAPESRGAALQAEDVRGITALLAYLARKRAAPERYRKGVELGRGATSRVYLAQDLELEREVAMKVHEQPRPAVLRRFVREARVIGRLDHPGIVAVHDLGLDQEGRVYFTMRRIHGRSLKELLQEQECARDPASRRRFLEAVVRVCDTLAFAHARGVVHRDVKPSNVMLGHFGEVYLVDWGLARVGEEPCELDPAPLGVGPAETLAGQVLGTPAYMAPEQALGKPEAVGPRSDVYALGSILFHYLCGHAPFCAGDSSPTTEEVLQRIVSGAVPVLPAEVRAREPELSSITARAMAGEASARYPGAAELAADLRAYLDGRAVRAHPGGVLYRGAKWVRRNRALSAGLVGALALAMVSLTATREAQARKADLRFLADLRGPLGLLDEFDTLWPATPEHAAAIADWIRRAEELRARAPEYAAELERLRRTGARLPVAAHANETHALRRQERIHAAQRALVATRGLLEGRERGEIEEGPSLETLRTNLASLERAHKAFQAWPTELESRAFTETETQLLHDRLEHFLAELDFVLGRHAPSERLLLARAALAVAGRVADAGPVAWDEVRAALQSDPRFPGLDLVPQRGLVPLGPDPASGLWEFAHVQSGRVPARAPDGRLETGADSAVVLVLVPGGRCQVGAQASDPAQSLHDPHAQRHDGPRLDLELAPFFLSKYELTLGQWCRLMGLAPELHSRQGPGGQRLDLPAFGVTGEWAATVLRSYGLELPTSVAWEFAARAGTRSIWWCGDDLASLEGCANVADLSWLRGTNTRAADVAGAVPFDDGHLGLAPVGSFRPNPFGLHDTIGNVAEWCRDVTLPYHKAFMADTGELAPRVTGGLQIARGGHADQGAYAARSAAREYVPPTTCPGFIGFRPSRRVEP